VYLVFSWKDVAIDFPGQSHQITQDAGHVITYIERNLYRSEIALDPSRVRPRTVEIWHLAMLLPLAKVPFPIHCFMAYTPRKEEDFLEAAAENDPHQKHVILATLRYMVHIL
jgi:hypothetical protein